MGIFAALKEKSIFFAVEKTLKFAQKVYPPLINFIKIDQIKEFFELIKTIINHPKLIIKKLILDYGTKMPLILRCVMKFVVKILDFIFE